MIKKVNCKLEGVAPLLMHAYPMKPIEALEKKPPEEQAELAAYRMPGDSRHLYVPGVALQSALVAGASYSKGKGRASLARPTAACVLVEEPYLDLGTDHYEIDSRPVVIPATKGRVMRHRPRLDKWSVTATISYDDTLVSAIQLRQIVDDTGKRVGLLDFRPDTKGPFGRFVVVLWEGV